MNSGELTRIQLANRLVCASQQISVGPTGPTGSGNAGPTGPLGPTGSGITGSAGPTGPGALYSVKAFTIYVDYSAGGGLKRVYIPPGLFTNPLLSAGGTFTANVGTDLVFLGNPNIVIQNTTYPFIMALSANGYVSTNGGQWQLVSPSLIRPGNGFLNVTTTADYSATIGADYNAINAASLTPYPSTGTAAGFLGMITLFYI